MARIRTIKPEFWSSPDTAACEDPWARLLYVAMWNWADDAGRGTAIPKELAGFAFPNDEKIDSADIRRMLGEIRRAFGVVFYTVGGRPYYAIPSWEKHQKIDKRSGPKYPAPEEGVDWDPDPNSPPDQRRSSPSADPAGSSAESAEDTPRSRRTPGAGTGEQGNRGTGERASAAPVDHSRTDRAPARPDRRRGEHTPAVELVATAQRPDAYRLVSEWARRSSGVTTGHRRELGKAVSDLLEQGAEPDLISEALDESHGPRWRNPVAALPHAYEDVRRRHAAQPAPLALVVGGHRTANPLGEGTAAERANAFLAHRKGTR